LLRLGVQSPHLARRPPYRLENLGHARAASSNANIRYRAFPARLVKLYEYISKDQQAMIFDAKGSGNWRALKRGAQ